MDLDNNRWKRSMELGELDHWILIIKNLVTKTYKFNIVKCVFYQLPVCTDVYLNHNFYQHINLMSFYSESIEIIVLFN